MSRINILTAAALIPALLFGSSQVGGQTDPGGDALTIYSTAQPGAISPELYRNGGRGQAIPGYAVVRQQRDINLTQNIADKAGRAVTAAGESVLQGLGVDVNGLEDSYLAQRTAQLNSAAFPNGNAPGVPALKM